MTLHRISTSARRPETTSNHNRPVLHILISSPQHAVTSLGWSPRSDGYGNCYVASHDKAPLAEGPARNAGMAAPPQRICRTTRAFLAAYFCLRGCGVLPRSRSAMKPAIFFARVSALLTAPIR